jgi:hypothetical protein
MKKLWLFSVPLLSLLLTACGSSESSETLGQYGKQTKNPKQEVPIDVAALTGMSDADVWNQELRVLQNETPKQLNIEAMYKDYGYSEFPSRIFARKGKPTDEDRKNERMPAGRDESAAHRFLMRLGQQIYQQSLLAHKSGETVHADNAVLLIRKIVDTKLGFMSDPKNPGEHNDNRFLETAWFLSLVARGARILDTQMTEDWKNKSKWSSTKADLNQWIGGGINQNWPMSEAPHQTPLNLAAQAGLMNWVGDQDSLYGSTNRTFAAIEALMRVAELRNGHLGFTAVKQNAWNKAQNHPMEHDGNIRQLFQTFRGYLHYYFNVPLNSDPKLFILKYNPGRSSVNYDPNLLNKESCRDPAKFSYKADCLVNKDSYRNDTYHPLMGFASILHILDIAKRWGYDLSPEEHDKVIMGLRWAAMNNTPLVTSNVSTYGVPVWELAFRFYPAEKLGPYCQRDLAADRAADWRKRSSLAWGYSRVALGL